MPPRIPILLACLRRRKPSSSRLIKEESWTGASSQDKASERPWSPFNLVSDSYLCWLNTVRNGSPRFVRPQPNRECMHEIDTGKKNRNNVETEDVTWKTHNVGKTTAAHRLQKIPLYERNTLSRKRRGNDLSSSSSPHAAAVTQRRQRPLSLSHTRTLMLCTRT